MHYSPQVGVIDYGLGNKRSVYGALSRLDVDFSSIEQPRDFSGCTHLILPGVGAFGQGMKNLHERGLVQPLLERVNGGDVLLLGICLGMQLLASNSTEYGTYEGLGLIDAEVKELVPDDKTLPVPHVGWNQVRTVQQNQLTGEVGSLEYYYHVHSFVMHAANNQQILATCDYGRVFATVVARENVFGTQFHPEKSQAGGLLLLKNFVSLRA